MWEFTCADLMRLGDVLWHQAREEKIVVPNLNPSKLQDLDLPHKHAVSGMAMQIDILHEQADDVVVREASTSDGTLHCGVPGCKRPTITGGLPKVRIHMAAHKAKGELHPNACSWCGSTDSGCQAIVVKGVPQTAEEGQSGHCPRYYKFSLSAASKTTIEKPCTERPMRCPLCINETYVWKFAMQWHYNHAHSKELKHNEMPEEFRIMVKEWRVLTGEYTVKDLLG